jgi:hypothetical protein
MTIGPSLAQSQTEQRVIEGLDFILWHYEPPHWPRTISTTGSTEGWRHALVFNKEEALARFRAANFLSCRISAYPPREDWAYELLGQAPDFLFIDLDLEHFPSQLSLDRALNKTLRNIVTAFRDDKIRPTVIWSGNGYHVYLPVQAFVLESESVFSDLVKGSECSRKFLQFAERFLSRAKADECHSKGLSFKNCMVRIPGSINSKNSEAVRIVQEWNGIRPAINWLLCDFRRYLIQDKIDIAKGRTLPPSPYVVTTPTKWLWVETLLKTPIHDYRKYAVWRILAPYLINVRKLTYYEAFILIEQWLKKCNSLCRLDFKAEYRIKFSLKSAIRIGYYPISSDRLKTEKRELYGLIAEKKL